MLTDEVVQLLLFKQCHDRHKQSVLQIYCCKPFEGLKTNISRKNCASQAQFALGS